MTAFILILMVWGDIGIILTIIFTMLFYLGGLDSFAKILFAELSDIKREVKEINRNLSDMKHND